MKMTIEQALARLPGPATARYPQGAPSVELMRHGTMVLKVYAPQGKDIQTPHTQDELYFVIDGRGTFVNGAERVAFEPGDCLFVAAGVEHRFVDFTPDFKTWVVFWGPEGGEAA